MANYSADYSDKTIAIIGMACKFPGASSKADFWKNQRDCRNQISIIPQDRWQWENVHGDPIREAARSCSKWGAFMQDIELFDPSYFNISPSEAELMDPQHRIFLQAVWDAIFDAGYTPETVKKSKLGVFVGVQFQEYQKLIDTESVLSARVCTGNAQTMLANRVSYLLDVTGPSESIDTSCSSSLVALQHAVSAIRNGSCDWAIVGGANLMLVPDVHIMGSQLGVLSPTGNCRPLDADADGYVRGEGVGAILLKSVKRAVEDDDYIYALVKGVATNHGGKAISLTAPSSTAQHDVMQTAIQDAGVNVEDISYVEMHATGTVVGDPSEYSAIKRILNPVSQISRLNDFTQMPCVLASVKSNIGHLEAASGMAGIINTALAISYRWIPGMSSFSSVNSGIDLRGTRFQISSDGRPWLVKDEHANRHAIVNSFGFGGTNGAVILSEFQGKTTEERVVSDDNYMIPISVATVSHLEIYCRRLLDAINVYIDAVDDNFKLSDLVNTLCNGRQTRPERRIIRTQTLSGLIDALQSIVDGRYSESVFSAENCHHFSNFPKFASQWLNDGTAVWPAFPGARKIPLPAVPWTQRPYWYKQRNIGNKADDLAGEAYVYLRPVWNKLNTRAIPPIQKNEIGKNVLLLGHNASELYVLEKRISERGERLLVRSVVLDDISELNNDIEEKFRASDAFRRLYASGFQPDAIIVLSASEHWSGSISGDTLNSEMQHLFLLTKNLLSCFFRNSLNLTYIVNELAITQPGAAALSAFAKSVYLENNRFIFNILFSGRTNNEEDVGNILSQIKSEPDILPSTDIVGQAGTQKLGIETFNLSEANESVEPVELREGGIYVIPGGAGELGQRFSLELVNRYKAKVILLGRAPFDGERLKLINSLESETKGRGDLRYLQCDLSSLEETKQAVEKIRGWHGRIDGVISMTTAHSDSFVFNKTWLDFRNTMNSKVAATVNLDLATADLNLDFFAIFSSQAAMGIAGGSDYAYGCEFQNAFSQWRSSLTRKNERSGRSVSINWSRWKWDKHVSDKFDHWALGLGYQFIEMEAGFECFERILRSKVVCVYALHGDREKILNSLSLPHAMLNKEASQLRWEDSSALSVHDIDHEINALSDEELLILARELNIDISSEEKDLQNSTEFPDESTTESAQSLKSLQKQEDEGLMGIRRRIENVLKHHLGLESLSLQTDFPSVGVDSIIAVDVVIALEAELGVELNPTWLFEHPTIQSLADRIFSLVENRREITA